MSSVNGVHALLALLMQQAQPTKTAGENKIDVKQLELLLQESRLLNERLLNIEKLLAIAKLPDVEKSSDVHASPIQAEHTWPTAGMVRDLINRQERQQAYGNWENEAVANREAETFTHRIASAEEKLETPELQRLLIQRYIPTDSDLVSTEISKNYGARKNLLDQSLLDAGKYDLDQDIEDRSRLIAIAIGLALLLLALFAAIG